MDARCHKCGRVKCETCGGTAIVDSYDLDDTWISDECPECQDGWRAATMLGDPSKMAYWAGAAKPWTGDDPAVLCPECANAK